VKRFVSLQLLNPRTVDRTPWTGDQPGAKPLHTHTQNRRTQTSMHRMGFEPTIPVFKREKTVHTVDRAATVIGARVSTTLIFPLPAFLSQTEFCKCTTSHKPRHLCHDGCGIYLRNVGNIAFWPEELSNNTGNQVITISFSALKIPS
jgi:hypothetical protein